MRIKINKGGWIWAKFGVEEIGINTEQNGKTNRLLEETFKIGYKTMRMNLYWKSSWSDRSIWK